MMGDKKISKAKKSFANSEKGCIFAARNN